MPDSHPLLLEIGVEELPASFVDAALAALPDLAKARLAEVRLTHGAIHPLGTPRRLAILVEKVPNKQADVDEEVVGPPETAAFKDGQPTKAAEAFATKLGVPLASLKVVDKPAEGRQKAGRYLVGRRAFKGAPASEVLGKALSQLCAEIPFKKSMRWGSGTVSFGRPVQWLVALHGEDVLDMSFAGIRSGRVSRGHRFLSPDTFEIEHASDYVEDLAGRHVLVEMAERERTMMERVAQAAKAAGGTADTAPILVEENRSLVEEPFVITGSFDEAFLTLPAAVIRAVARGHQRTFCVEVGEDELTRHYLTVVNTALDVPTIRKGNDAVMRARLSDARFFFEEDKKVKLEDRVAKLQGIVFHQKLGTVREKVTRMERLAGLIAQDLGIGGKAAEYAVRAAHLSKFDLVSHMVGEFPELQGAMGRTYAKHAGEPDAVADAVRDHYRPAFATDAVAPSDISAIVALADRIDTLAGCFAVGLEPSGAADPYALRRACIAVLRTLLDKGLIDPRYAKLDLLSLFAKAREGFTGALEKDTAATVAALTPFATERLRGLLASATNGAVADAVLADASEGESAPVRFPTLSLVRAKGLFGVVQSGEAWLAQAKTVAKRLAGISKQSKAVFHAKGDFEKPDDAVIVKVVEDVDVLTKSLHDEMTVRQALAAAGALASRLEAIFVSTLVNDPADAKTPARLELLSYGAMCMRRIADFSRLG